MTEETAKKLLLAIADLKKEVVKINSLGGNKMKKPDGVSTYKTQKEILATLKAMGEEMKKNNSENNG